MQQLFADPRWYLGTTLNERIESPRAVGGGPAGSNLDMAMRRLVSWRAQEPFADDAHFRQRLRASSTSETEILQVLGDSPESIRDRFGTPPEWLKDLRSAFCGNEPGEPFDQDLKVNPLYRIASPLVSRALGRLREEVLSLRAQYTDAPFDPDVVRIFHAGLALAIVPILARAAILELNIARLEGRLVGETPEARFDDFVESMSHADTALRFFADYPLLARLLVECVNRWCRVSAEFLRRLAVDWPAIRRHFSPDADPGQLVKADTGVGDQHNDGHAVVIATFASGFRLVYKPRSLAADRHFQEFLGWLNDRGLEPALRTLKVLECAGYGWTEFISQEGCGSAAAVERFYRRVGAYLAIFHILAGTDFHYENLIACDEHPFFIDLEALFHPRVRTTLDGSARSAAFRRLNDSVLGIGLLPQKIAGNERKEGIDLSGIGAKAGQLTPFALPIWESYRTDEMRLTRKHVVDGGAQNRPSLGGAEVDADGQAEAIVSGFEDTYRLLLAHRSELLSESGPVRAFDDDEVRVIFRPTRAYAMLLYESFHPDVLQDGADRDFLLDRLWERCASEPYLAAIVPFEQGDLRNGDVPKFTACPSSRDLYSSSGERLVDFLDESTIDLVLKRLNGMSEEDLAWQSWTIRGSLASAGSGRGRRSYDAHNCSGQEHSLKRDDLLSAARAIGDRLKALAISGDDGVSWVGLTTLANDRTSVLPLDVDLYDGLPGVILFLAHLGAITADPEAALLAERALSALKGTIIHRREFVNSIGAFSGWGGIIYAFTEVAMLWKRAALLEDAQTLAANVLPLIGKDNRFGVLDGAAGCILALLNLHTASSSASALRAAIECGGRLLECAVAQPHGVGWISEDSPAPLTGLSHGNAGIALALMRLKAVTGDERFSHCAARAMEYERSLFSPEFNNWPDLRAAAETASDGAQYSAVSWCHGAAGIGLARLACRSLLPDDPRVMEEITAALDSTLKRGFGRSHCLCHGDMGNLDLIIEATRGLGGARWAAQLKQKAGACLDSIAKHGWRCGVPPNVQTPGLMTGLSGIGYELLRLAEPDKVPSVLLLESVNRGGRVWGSPVASSRRQTALQRAQSRGNRAASAV
ncbi:MAG TPA: type 2 lanthipeptide synthetase LanM family protein [Steroidobacteraceae bacterium]|nr:type 2 lanthipeptide synthetase LanM family protein [Steroidobacteraceae bacterium]